MEKKKGFEEAILSKNNNVKIPFFYLGKNNDWKKIINKDFQKEINTEFNASLNELSYIYECLFLMIFIIYSFLRGHSSVVERLVANEKVEGSTPFARSKNTLNE